MPVPTQISFRYDLVNLLAGERLDVVLSLFSQPCGGAASLYLLGQLVLLFAGAYLVCGEVVSRPLQRAAAALMFAVSTAALAGFDAASLRTHWYPLLLFAMMVLSRPRLSSGRRCLAAVVFALVCALWIWSAGSLAFFGLAAAVFSLAAAAAGRPAEETCPVSSGLFWFIAGAAFLAASLLIPSYPMPDYPPGSRVAPASPFFLYERPIIGPYMDPFPLVYGTYIRSAKRCALLLLFICLPLFAAGGASTIRSRLRSGAAAALAACVIIIGGEWLLAGERSYLAPFPALARIMPGLALAALPRLLAPFALMLVLLLALRTAALRQLIASLLVSVLVFALWRPEPGLCPPPENAEAAGKVRHSPSGFLVSELGKWAAEPGAAAKRDLRNLIHLQRGKDFDCTIQAGAAPDQTHLALDGEEETRWSTAGPQRNGDWFSMSFDREIAALRIALSVRLFPADFPRGVQVWAGNTEGDAQLIVDQPSWLGEVQWSPSGYPFFGPQSKVIIDLPEERRFRFLKVVQTGQAPFDWSIGEVKLYAAPRHQ